MMQLLEALISGATIGSVYFIIAVGFSLIYGVSRVLVYSYGSFFTWGAYFAWIFAIGVLKLNYFLVFLFVIPLMALMGFLLEKIVIKPLRSRPAFDWNVLLATLGVALVLDNLALVVFGARTKSLPLMIDGTIALGGLVLSRQQIFMFLFSIILAVVLSLVLSKTRIGMAMRAVAQDSEGAKIVGIPIARVFAYTFAICAVLAGLGGVLLAPRFYIEPLGGWDFLLKALIIVIVGGLGSIKGTFLGAFVLGILESLVGWQLGLLWVMPFWFIVLLVILLIRPQGFFGKEI